ncbi:uncharacterized protein SCHCODRAFT_02700411 [Schizophyllum commune H4-8]|uniref:uncharacterized protein n=1 Tax=Schizophyllum commune (strain H4-8 / FGSC 9210) TaxID=578458 RepID=UPI002160B50D|nr:uncharacterized protein SCHCODRAFT_02700411 [Schizophyllum commune H4-8]KAI5893829.1 hypothetical protein SCHCODRAFT_02700411 [Schizophyllum commune H4-8]
MSITTPTGAYRALLRELSKSAVNKGKVPPQIRGHYRTLVTRYGADEQTQNAVLFLRSQREHKALLERYNPLFNLTAEEHIKATANRVGLNMPITPDGSNPEGKE